MEDINKKIIMTVILISFTVLSFLLLKPILLSIITGILLAFIFNPIYEWIYKITKSKNFSAMLICVSFGLLIILPILFLTPILIEQTLRLYLTAQQGELLMLIQNISSSFVPEELSININYMIVSFSTKTTNFLIDSLSQLIINLPGLFLQSIVIFFTFFFTLRDKKQLISYVKNLLPFTENVKKSLFNSTRNITYSVLYGQVVVGIIQGILVGLGFFIFHVPNALILTLIASLAGILPVLGTPLIWVPVVIYLLIDGNILGAIGVGIFGILSATIDNFLKPMIISRKTKMHSAIVLIGMIGGFFLFGILGFILGPLILAYLFMLIEIYRKKC